MKKGKFGIVLCFYPIAAFAAAILNSPLICAGLVAVAVFLERDEWAARQSLQAWMLSAFVYFLRSAANWGLAQVTIPFISHLLSITSAVLLGLVTLAVLFFSVLGIIRTAKGGEANIPLLAELAYRAYGKVKPRPAASTQYIPYASAQPQAQAFPGQNVPPYPSTPVQPNGPQPGVPYAQPYAVPQYTPPQQPIPGQPMSAPASAGEQQESNGSAG